MIFLFVLVVAALAMAFVALRRADDAISRSDELEIELNRMRGLLEASGRPEGEHVRGRSVVPSEEEQIAVADGASAPSPDEARVVPEPSPEPMASPSVSDAVQHVEPASPALQPEPLGEPAPAPESVPLAPEPAPPTSEPEHPGQSIAASLADTSASAPIQPAAEGAGGDAERTFATKWTVWIGGIALAMGGLLIVRYSIEAGFFGPGVRLMMGAAFSLVMAVASELMRRRDLRLEVRASFADQIPAVLAGVSVLSAFGVVYAAHAVYEMIGPGPAFALMGIIGLSALAASLLHGPRFALFGLLGSYATPIMVSGTEPNYLALSVFIAIVTSAAFLLHMRRPSTALVAGAILGHSLWTSLIALGGDASGWGYFLLIVAVALATLHVESAERSRQRHATEVGKRETWAALAAFAAPLVLAGFVWVEEGGDLASRLTLIVIVAGNVLAAIRHPGLAPLAPLTGAAATGVILLWPDPSGPLRITPQLILDLVRLDLVPSAAPGLSLFAVLLGTLVAVPLLASLLARWRNGDGDPVDRGCLAFASALAPVCTMLATSLRLNGLNRTTAFAILAAILAIVAAAISELLYRQERARAPSGAGPLAFVGSAAYAAAGAIALGLAIAFALRETWLVVGFAVASGGVALVARSRPIPLLRSIAGALGTAALARAIWHPILVDVGDLPILNWLVVVYGLPALAFGVAAWALGGRRDRALSVVEGLACLFLTAFVGLELAQGFAGANLREIEPLLREMVFPFWYDPDLVRAAGRAKPITALVALATIASAFLAALFMLLRLRTMSPVFAVAEKGLSTVAVLAALVGLGVFLNPIFNGVPVLESPILNRLLLGYVVPAAVLALLATALPRPDRTDQLHAVLEALAVILGVLGAVLVLRHCFTGSVMSVRSVAAVGFYESVSTTLLLLVLAAVVVLWREQRSSSVLHSGFVGIVVVGIGYAAVILGIAKNPIVDRSMIEGPILFNRALWGYAPVAIGFLVLARWAGRTIGWLYRALLLAAAATTYLMIFLLLRQGFHGPTLFSHLPITLAEAGMYGGLAFITAFLGIRLPMSRAATGEREPSGVGLAALAVGVHIVVLAVAIDGGGRLVGWPLLNNSIPALLLPAALAGSISLWSLAPPLARFFRMVAVVEALIYVVVQIRFIFHGVTLVSELPVTLAEAGAFGTLALIIAFVASRSLIEQEASYANEWSLRLWAFLAVGVPTVLLAVAAVHHAPIVGWPMLNNSLLGVLAPTVLAAMMSLWSRKEPSGVLVSRIYGAAAVVGGLVFVLLQVRAALPETEGFEDLISGSHKGRLFGYSLAIIAYGIALLVTGFRMALRDLRLAALAVVGLAVAKVFLLDLAGLEGLWRAMSFIGLGAGLLGIAYLYRWLEPERGEPARAGVAR